MQDFKLDVYLTVVDAAYNPYTVKRQLVLLINMAHYHDYGLYIYLPCTCLQERET